MKNQPANEFTKIEEDVLEFWKKRNIFKKSLEKRKDSPKFIFYDGPPFATGLPHYGHILAMTIKDVVTRYKTMQGFNVPRRNGWDCHGLPVEYQLEKELGIKTKADIEKYGVANFNKAAREIVMRYTWEWKATMERMGRWVDMENAYTTMSNEYIESVWWAFGQIWDKGLVYQDYRVSPYCPRCGTTLSNFEVSQGYRDVNDESIYVKFKCQMSNVKTNKDEILKQVQDDASASVQDDTDGSVQGSVQDNKESANVYLLVWTTTPWTLPGNSALAINSEVVYCKVKMKNEKGKSIEDSDFGSGALRFRSGMTGVEGSSRSGMTGVDCHASLAMTEEGKREEYLILAKDRLGVLDKEYKIVEEFNGNELIGLEYEPLYGKTAGLAKEKNNLYKIWQGDFVSMEEGTGIVHIAPSFGEDDMKLGQLNKIAGITSVDESGKVVKDYGIPGEGKFVKEADKDIIANLKERGILYKEERITHAYPYCWRCETPLIYYAMPSWFIGVSRIRNDLIKNNQDIRWVPAHLKEGRFGKWLEGAKDWAISRNRYWGAPIPVWQCQTGKLKIKNEKIKNNIKNQKNCRHIKVIKSLNELQRLSIDHLDTKNLDLHKPYIDEVTIKCEKCGGQMRRIPEVFDCWFESGAMPYGQWHYPFENKEIFEQGFPADFIAEGVDQTRGWFYTMHVLATIIKNKPAFKNVVVNGLVLASDGKKLSKSLRNYTEPEKIFTSLGVDGLRYFLLVSTPIGEDYRFSEEVVREQVRKFLLPLWNSYQYLTIYRDFAKKGGKKTILDEWMEARLNQATGEINKWMNKYELTKAARILTELVSDLSTWYIRRSRKRDDKIFFQTLAAVLKQIVLLAAPFTPFIAEELYQKLRENGDPESVHLSDYTKASGETDKAILGKMKIIRMIAEIGHALRAEAGIKVRQPLSRMGIRLDKSDMVIDEDLKGLLSDELNVRQIAEIEKSEGEKSVNKKEIRGITVWLDTKITDELKREGMVRDLIRQVQGLRKESGCRAGEEVKIHWQSAEFGEKAIDDELLKEVAKETRSVFIKEKNGDLEGKKVAVDDKIIVISIKDEGKDEVKDKDNK